MLWEEGRQEKDCLAYYRRLIRIRHEYPVLTKGILAVQYADDNRGTLYLERKLEEQYMILIFHVRKGNVELPGLEGWRNLITEEKFTGRLGGYETAVLVPMQ